MMEDHSLWRDTEHSECEDDGTLGKQCVTVKFEVFANCVAFPLLLPNLLTPVVLWGIEKGHSP